MLLHEFGSRDASVVVMLHGLAMRWEMLRPAADALLAQAPWHVFCVAVPGMDPDEDNVFTSVEEIAAQIEDALLARGIRSAACLYGLSMGGGIALRMLADNRIAFRSAVLDGGITPYELPRLFTRVILLCDVLSTLLGKASMRLLSLAFPPRLYTRAAVESMHGTLRRMTLGTIVRAYDSTDNYSMPAAFPSQDTHITYWWGSREKRARRLDIQYVQKHVPGIRLREIPEMAHGQYLMRFPGRLALDLAKEAGRG